jgi:hypothetical protein
MSWHFPDIKESIDKVERVFADKKDLRRASRSQIASK